VIKERKEERNKRNEIRRKKHIRGKVRNKAIKHVKDE
jgi:hypothetical protein